VVVKVELQVDILDLEKDCTLKAEKLETPINILRILLFREELIKD
jgi:hypothetical protein